MRQYKLSWTRYLSSRMWDNPQKLNSVARDASHILSFLVFPDGSSVDFIHCIFRLSYFVLSFSFDGGGFFFSLFFSHFFILSFCTLSPVYLLFNALDTLFRVGYLTIFSPSCLPFSCHFSYVFRIRQTTVPFLSFQSTSLVFTSSRLI